MKKKRTKGEFRKSMKEVMSREKLTKIIVRRFARRARGYTCVYYHLAYGNNKNNVGENISPTLIKSLVKAFKIHRCALDFEGKFIKVEVDNAIEHAENNNAVIQRV